MGGHILYLSLILWAFPAKQSETASTNELLEKHIGYDESLVQLRSKQTGYAGDSLVIGSPPEYVFGDMNSRFLCEKKSDLGENVEIYRTEVMKRSSRSYQITAEETKSLVDYSDYFVLITRELDECIDQRKDKKAKKEKKAKKNPGFLRIVNHLMSIKEIYEVKYYDGVEVSSINHLGNERRVKIIETKYLSQKDRKFVTYEGRIIDSVKPNTQLFIPGLIKKYDRNLFMEPKKEVMKNRKSSSRVPERSEDPVIKAVMEFVKVSDSGKTLKIGYDIMEVHDTYTGEFRCQEVQGMNPFPHEFRPKCYQQVQAENSDKTFYAKIRDQDFLNYFAIVERKVWSCTSGPKSVLRVVTELIGITQVKNLDYQSGINSLYSITVPGGKSIRFKEIRYLDGNTWKLVNGNAVYFELVETEKLQSVALSLDQATKNKKEVEYALSPSTVYRTLISPEGYDLRVGSRAQLIKKLESERSPVMSHHRYEDEFKTDFKIKMNEDNVMHRMQEIKEEQEPKYYRYISKKAWHCQQDAYTFIQIINIIEVLVPVREIETVDGVEIFHTLLDNNKKSVMILETKYMEYPSLILIQIVGQALTIRPEFRARKFAISKTIDETVSKIGHSPERNLNYRDGHSWNAPNIINNNLKSLTIGKGHDRIVFNYPPDTFTREDIVECELLNTDDDLYPDFQISQMITSDVRKEKKEGNQHLIYFEKIVREVWSCKTMKNDNFLRIVTEESLKKSALKEIGMILSTYKDKVWLELENNDYVVKMNEIRYFRKPENNPINYWGHIVFEKKPRSGLWQSGTMQFLNDNPSRNHALEKNTNDYKLDRERKYKSYFAKAGDILEIGSKWQKLFGDKNFKIHCQMHQKNDDVVDETYQTSVLLLYTNQKTINVYETYFENLKQEIWKCVDKNGNEILRVLNQLSIKMSEGLSKIWQISHVVYYDGVTILRGDFFILPVQIIEVKYLDSKDSSVLKFEGKVELEGTDVGNIGVAEALKSSRNAPVVLPENKRRLESPVNNVLAKLDVHYLLEKNEVYKTVVDSKGMILEVGGSSYGSRYYSTDEMICTQNTIVDQDTEDVLKPRVVLSSYLEKVEASGSVTLKYEDIKHYFEFEHENWNCVHDRTNFKRIVNKLKLKKYFSVAQIYHYNNVKINLDDGVYLEEIKFLDETSKIIDFYGVVLYHNEKIDETHLHTLGKPFREIDYFLDTEIVYLANPSFEGGTYEVGTHWQKEFKNSNHVVTCMRKENKAIDFTLGTKVLNTKYNPWILITEEKSKDYFEAMDQDVWDCKINEEIVFYKVINKLFMSTKISRIYYTDGVTVRTLVFPDKSTGTQITEVKYVEQGTNKVLKYDGEMRMETNNVVDRLIKIPSAIAEQNLVPLTNKPTEVVYNPSTITHLTLDALTIYSLRKMTESADGIINGIDYSQNLLTTVFIGSGYRSFRIGSHWNEVFRYTTAEKRCLLDQWNKSNRLRYIPTIMEYVDGSLYELDEDGLSDIFEIMETEVWICTNKLDSNKLDTILRVDTHLRGKIPIYSIRHYDGVQVEIFELESGLGKSVDMIETVYIDPKNSKLLKYEGNLHKTRKSGGILEGATVLFEKAESRVVRMASLALKGIKKKLNRRSPPT